MTDDDLDDLFADLRAEAPPQPSSALMARILADAEAAQPRRAAPRRPAPPRFSLATLFAALGGAGSLAGLATAAIAGVWIGFAPPAAVDDLAASLWSGDEADSDSLELFPDLEGMIDDADG